MRQLGAVSAFEPLSGDHRCFLVPLAWFLGPAIFRFTYTPDLEVEHSCPSLRSACNQFDTFQGSRVSADTYMMAPSSPTSKSAHTHTPTSEPKPPRQRLPPPTLFQAPPSLSLSLTRSRSPNASNLSLPLPSFYPTATTTTTNPNPNPNPTTTTPTKPPSHRPQPSSPQNKHPAPDPNTDADADADALWLSMQHTLAEVELTAASARNLHVFGPQHAAALAQLRGAQIALAQAWARGSGDGDGDGEGEADDRVVEDARTDTHGPAEGLGRDAALGGAEGGKGAGAGGKGKEFGTGTGSGDGNGNGNGDGIGNGPKSRPRRGSRLAEETASDILLARKRREANDRYFARVSASVGDVVERLEGVADAMRKVERESRDVWSSGGESSLGTSASGSASGE